MYKSDFEDILTVQLYNILYIKIIFALKSLVFMQSYDNYLTIMIKIIIVLIVYISNIYSMSTPLGGYSHTLTIRVCAAVQGMVFKPFCQKQGIEHAF